MDAIERIRDTLKAAGLSVYKPGQCPDVCQAKYIVAKPGGTYPFAASNKVGFTLATVFLYVPLDKHEELEPLSAQVQTLLKPLQSQVRPTGNISPDIIEDLYRAHSRSIEYMVLKTL